MSWVIESMTNSCSLLYTECLNKARRTWLKWIDMSHIEVQMDSGHMILVVAVKVCSKGKVN